MRKALERWNVGALEHWSGRPLQRSGVLVFILVLLFGFWPVGPVQAQASGVRCFDETGFCVAGRLAEFWAAQGGLPVFGLPISPLREIQREGRGLQVQWFERARLELHPDQAPPFDVLIGRIGVESLAAQSRDWQNLPAQEPEPGCRYFGETGRNVCGPILAAWQVRGLEFDRRAGSSDAESLALWGLPISPLQAEQLADGRSYQVQWFERARFELHPENPPAYQVLTGLLGRDLYQAGEGAVVPQLAAGACPFAPPAGVRVDCATLVLPQDAAEPAGRSVTLAIAIFRAPAPAPDPIVYLSGGPGSPALASAAGLYRSWRSFAAGRDFIFVDQRGTGFSWPALRCPEVSSYNRSVAGQGLDNLSRLRGEAGAFLQCKDRFAQNGVSMAHFNSATAAADLDLLRAMLGYEQWNLFGISYGTRLALTILRDYPGSVRSAVLDSPYPPHVDLYTTMPANLQRSLQQLFADCAAQPDCQARYPDLEPVFFALVDELEREPRRINLNGSPITLDGDRLVGTMFRLFYRSGILPRLPEMIYGVRDGNYGPLRELLAQRSGGGAMSEAHYYAVQCAEELALTPAADRAAALAAYPRFAGFYSSLMELSPAVEELCAGFGVAAADPRENELVRSDVPVLLLSGSYDPITPPDWGPAAAAGLSRSYHYAFPGTGHAVIGRGACPAGMIRAFLNDPGRAPDAGCVERLGAPAFR